MTISRVMHADENLSDSSSEDDINDRSSEGNASEDDVNSSDESACSSESCTIDFAGLNKTP